MASVDGRMGLLRERHAWASLAVEMSALEGFVSRSAFLYFDLLQQAVAILALTDISQPARGGEAIG